MNTAIYKGHKQQGSYLYLAQKDDFSQIPDVLLMALGKLEFVMSLELYTKEGIEKKLAQADVQQVIKALKKDGFYFQMQRSESERLLLASKLPSSNPIPKL